MYLTPKAGSGRAAFVMVNNGETRSIEAEASLSTNAWYKLIVSIKDKVATLSVNDTVAASNTIAVYPEDVRADAHYLARGQDGGWFNGQLSDMKIYQRP